MQLRTKQRIRLFLKSVLLLFTAMILAGIAYEQIGERQDRKRFPQIGRSVDIGGRSLNIYCSGEGGPTVILDTGGSAPGYGNLLFSEAGCAIHARLLVRSCWFGMERSEPHRTDEHGGCGGPARAATCCRSSFAVCLGRFLFQRFNVRVFAGKYPSEVAGAVLVDSAHEDQYRYERGVTLGPFNRLPKPIRNLLCACVPMAAHVGLVRLLLKTSGLPGTHRKDLRTSKQHLARSRTSTEILCSRGGL